MSEILNLTHDSEQTIFVKLKVTSWYKKFTNGILEQIIEIVQGTTAADLMEMMKIPDSEVGSFIVSNILCCNDTNNTSNTVEITSSNSSNVYNFTSGKNAVDNEFSKIKRSVDASYVLVDGDVLQIIPFLAGG